MREDIQNPKLIIKNGVLLFVRLLLVMAMSFYTTRLTLQILGDENFGINNIIGGIISVFAVVSLPITGVLQRFFNVEFTKQEIPAKVVFNTSFRIIVIMTIVMVIIYETIGLYLTNFVLTYPVDRKLVVNTIFQFTILTTICHFFSLLYAALLIAKEKMGIPASVDIISGIMKLLFLVCLPFIDLDILVAYSILLLLVDFIQLLFYMVYCWRNYEESHLCHSVDRKLLNVFLHFSGLSFMNSAAGISLAYLSNIFINVFGGVLYNTAYGISQQLSNAVISFTGNVLKAADPQITSTTTAGITSYRDQIVLSIIKISFLGCGFFYILFSFYGEFMLGLWLKTIPNYVLAFCEVQLLKILFVSICMPLRTVILATGEIKYFYLNYFFMSMFANLLMLTLLKMNFPIITVLYLVLAVEIGIFINAIYTVHRTTTIKYFQVLEVMIRSVAALLCGASVLRLMREDTITFVGFFLSALFSFIILILVAILIATNSQERGFIKQFARKIFHFKRV